jgi:putative endonuclease
MRRRTHHSADRFGRLAEYGVMLWLTLKGYRILAHRLKTPVGEIDILCATRHALIIVEVKARRDLTTAASVLYEPQQQRLKQAAGYVQSGYPYYAARAIRFDCCAVSCYMQIRHIKNAFS